MAHSHVTGAYHGYWLHTGNTLGSWATLCLSVFGVEIHTSQQVLCTVELPLFRVIPVHKLVDCPAHSFVFHAFLLHVKYRDDSYTCRSFTRGVPKGERSRSKWAAHSWMIAFITWNSNLVPLLIFYIVKVWSVRSEQLLQRGNLSIWNLLWVTADLL